MTNIDKLEQLKNTYQQYMDDCTQFYKTHKDHKISDYGTLNGIILAINILKSDKSVKELLSGDNDLQ